MRLFYDRQSDSLYLGLSQSNEYQESIEAAPGVVLDFDRSGRLLGIDLERASQLMDVSDLTLHEEPAGTDVENARLDGAKIRKERERIGLSQLELARQLSVSPNTIARWERGELKIEHPGMLQLALKSLGKPANTSKRVANPVKQKVEAAYSKSMVRDAVTGRIRGSSQSAPKPVPSKARAATKKRRLTSR